jgi:hypothetical protein
MRGQSFSRRTFLKTARVPIGGADQKVIIGYLATQYGTGQ